MVITGKYAASSIIYRQGIILDLDKKCFMKTSRIIGLFNFKEPCRPLPKIDYVLMFKTFYAKCEPCSLDEKDSPATAQLSLVYNKNRKLIIHESRNMKEIKDMAALLAQHLNLKLKDSATDRRNPKWVSPANILNAFDGSTA
jgi:hypothetical protein